MITRILRRLSVFLAIFFSAALATPAAAGQLYAGEEAISAAGYPAIARFTKGDPDKPLLVFVPGAHHMARVAYGGHDGARREDFLAHWLARKGYSLLALSYPMDSQSKAFDTAHPDFTARAWGRQVAEIAARKIQENGLSRRVVLLAWSMGGKVVQPAYEASREAGLEMEGAIALAATPGIPGLISLVSRLNKAPSGYLARPSAYDGYFRQVQAQGHRNGREAVPEAVFKREYVGDFSINLLGYGEVYRDGAFHVDVMAQANDYKAFSFDDYPLVGVIMPTDPADSRHAITDQSLWAIYNSNTVLHVALVKAKIDPAVLPAERWRGLVDLARSLEDRLTVEVSGNHFFFIGEDGARATAEAVEQLIGKIRSVRRDIVALGQK